MSEPIVQVRNLKKHFTVNNGLIDRLLGADETVQAVNGVSFDIEQGETLGLVGESGSGKSTVARTVIRLEDPTAGTVHYDGTDLSTLSGTDLKEMRKRVQMVFQDPASSLNRRKNIAQIIRQPMEIHGLFDGERNERVEELMETVGLPSGYANRYPHEFSGGQRQRIGIARALALEPEFLICDEPVSALDVSIQAQILNLLHDLQSEFDLTILFIAHDLSVIRHVCDRVAVMYLGEIMETAETEHLFEHPQHPYTRSLLRAVPEPEPALAQEREALAGQVPSPIHPPDGCVFHTRCPEATEECSQKNPPLEQIDGASDGHRAACLYAREFELTRGIASDREQADERYSVEGFDYAEQTAADGRGEDVQHD